MTLTKATDKLRNLAMYFEKEENYQTALGLMSIALELRPNGKLIQNKVELYKKQLVLLESVLPQQ